MNDLLTQTHDALMQMHDADTATAVENAMRLQLGHFEAQYRELKAELDELRKQLDKTADKRIKAQPAT